MKKIVINGSKELSGTINISGAKNSVVALIPAAILTDGIVKIENTPELSDTENLKKIIEILGGQIEFGEGEMIIDGKNVESNPIPTELSDKLRASYYFMGSLLGRFKHVVINFPGGCKIGKRPIDLHLKAFRKMGVTIVREGDKYTLEAKNLHGANILLDFPSVGATINILLAAVLAEGQTVIRNAAKEPEIINIISLLNNMGASIVGGGTDTIMIKGVKKLGGAMIEVIPDRIEAGTYMMIGALIGRDLRIANIIPQHLDILLSKMREMGVDYKVEDDSVVFNRVDRLEAIDIKTLVYPGFPTDLGQPMAVLLTQADGESKFEETIYESRGGHYPELIKMGAKMEYTARSSIIEGPNKLVGTDVSASDLRAGAALMIAGLIASGTTKISNIEHILRGYEDLVDKLSSVGADVKVIDE